MLGKRSRSFYSQLFFTVLSASLLLLILYTSVGLQLVQNAYNRIMIDVNCNMIHKTTAYIDSVFREVEDAINLVSNDADVLNSSLLPVINRYERNNGIVNKLNNIVSGYECIHSLVVYIPSHDFAMSSDFRIGSLETLVSNEIVTLFKNESVPHYFTLTDQNNCKHFYCLSGFPEGKNYSMGYIITEIETSALLEALRSQSLVIDDGYLLIDATGTVLLTTAEGMDMLSIEEYSQIIESENAGHHVVTNNSIPWRFFHDTSVKTGWKCVYYIQESRMMSLWRILLPVFIPAIIVFVAFCILITYLVTSHLYKPLERLLQIVLEDQISGMSYTPHTATANEYLLINDRFLNLIEQRDRMKDILDHAHALTKETFFHGMLLGHEPDENERKFYESNIQLDLYRTCQYAVFILQSNNASAKSPFIERRSEIIRVVKEECAETENYVYTSLDQKMLVALLVLHSSEDMPDVKSSLSKLVRNIKDALKTKNIITSIGISTVHNNMDEIKSAYDEALEALRYFMYIQNTSESEDTTADLATVGEVSETNEEPYMEIIHRIVNAIRSGDDPQVKLHLQELYTYIDQHMSLHSHSSMLILEVLLDAIMQMSIQSGLDISQVLSENETLYSDFGLLKDFSECKEYVENVCSQILLEVSKEISRKTHKYVRHAKSFIAEHYQDSNMGIKETAASIGINSAYLGKLFKTECGISFSDYLNHYRIDKSKEFLTKTHATVKEIGYLVGFSNVQSYIRTFKKIEGVTPGKYGNSL